MKRRPGEDELPARLLIFRTDEWPGADVHEQHAAWLAARDEWRREHGVQHLPGDPVPDEPLRPEWL